jgi:hypothetical protein
MIQRMDTNGDGKISKDEWRGPAEAFDQMDTNKDGFLTADELTAGMQNRMNAMQETMLNNIKTRLKATDEEWAVLKDLISKVTTAQQKANQYNARGMRGMFGGRGQRNRGGANAGGANAGANAGGANAGANGAQDQGGPGGGGPGGMGGPGGGMGGPGGGMGGPGGGFGGGMMGGPGGMGGQQAPELRALSAALDAEGATADSIKTSLTTYRAARDKAQATLKDARTNLQKVVTVQQEATLVTSGILE